MAYTPKQWGPTQLGSGTPGGPIVTGATASTITEILTITLVNYAATVTTVDLWIDTSTTLSNAKAIAVAMPIPPNSTRVLRGPWTLPSAQNLYAKASAGTAITIYVSGQEGS